MPDKVTNEPTTASSIFTPEAHAAMVARFADRRAAAKGDRTASARLVQTGSRGQMHRHCPYCGATADAVANVKVGDLHLVRSRKGRKHRQVMRVLGKSINAQTGSVTLTFRPRLNREGQEVPVQLVFPAARAAGAGKP